MRKSKQSKMRKISNNILNIHESITQTCNQWIFSDCNKILRERLWLWPPLITNHASKDNLWTSDTTQHQQETTYLGAWLNITVYYLQEASEHHQTSFTCLLSAHNDHRINPGWVLASGGHGHQVCALLLGSIFLHASSRWRWISGDWSGGVQSLSVHCPMKRFP